MVGLPGPGLDSETRARLREIRPAGVIAFRRNLTEVDAWIALAEELADLLDAPRLLAIDQEGGRVSRLHGWVGDTPSAYRLADHGGEAAYRFGEVTGRALHALGFNIDFAPVVDLCGPDATNGIGDRSFGLDPPTCTRFAGSFLDGLQRNGVAGCLKHFPGLGDTTVDSHDTLPVVTRDRVRLEQSDLVPYRLLRDRAAAVMIGHAHYPQLGDAVETPASLSRAVVSGLLREGIGFDGLVVTDDLEMGAVAPSDPDGLAAVRAVAAGCDLVLYCSDLDAADRALAALARAAAGDDGFARRLAAAVDTVRRTAARWPAGRPDRASWDAACDDLRRVAGEILSRDRDRSGS